MLARLLYVSPRARYAKYYPLDARHVLHTLTVRCRWSILIAIYAAFRMSEHQGPNILVEYIMSGAVDGRWNLFTIPERPVEWNPLEKKLVKMVCCSILLISAAGRISTVAGARQLRDALFAYDSRYHPLSVRICLANSTIYLNPTNSAWNESYEMFRVFAVTHGDIDTSLVDEAIKHGLALFPGPVYLCASQFVQSGSFPERWDSFLRGSVTTEGLTIPNYLWDPWGSRTPLQGLVKGAGHACLIPRWKRAPNAFQKSQDALRAWITLLSGTGVDIMSYGSWEAKQLSMARS